jgi:hypothetical protein
MRTLRWVAGAAAVALTMLGSPEAVEAQDDRSGVEIWSQTCGNCHRNQPGSRYSADKWRSILMHMRIDARLTDDETAAILAFLTRGDRSGDPEDQGDATDGEAGTETVRVDPYIAELGGVQVLRTIRRNN